MGLPLVPVGGAAVIGDLRIPVSVLNESPYRFLEWNDIEDMETVGRDTPQRVVLDYQSMVGSGKLTLVEVPATVEIVFRAGPFYGRFLLPVHVYHLIPFEE